MPPLVNLKRSGDCGQAAAAAAAMEACDMLSAEERGELKRRIDAERRRRARLPVSQPQRRASADTADRIVVLMATRPERWWRSGQLAHELAEPGRRVGAAVRQLHRQQKIVPRGMNKDAYQWRLRPTHPRSSVGNTLELDPASGTLKRASA
jgi:hypothetical protein